MTFDGVRAKEMFEGASEPLLRRETPLTPFLQGIEPKYCAVQPSLRIENGIYVSYPGYSEMLTGYANPQIRGNDYGPNPGATFMEAAVREGTLKRGETLVAASWAKFPDIYACARSGIGLVAARKRTWSERRRFARQVAPTFDSRRPAFRLPRARSNDRHDIDAYHAFLCAHRVATRRGRPPRAMHLALGMTDSYAHADNDYQYRNHLRLADSIVGHLWPTIDPDFVVVATDHGRGRGTQWTSHGPDVAGCGESWCVVLCNPTRYREMPSDVRRAVQQCRRQGDVARLMVMLLRRRRPRG